MNFRKYTPHVVAVLIFFAVTFIAFPQLFFGKVLDQTDLKQFRGMSHQTIEFRKKYHTEPLWLTSMFCGMPTTQVSTLYPGNYLNTVDDALHLWLPRPARYIFLGLIGFFILMLSLKIEPRLAIVGSLAFGLGTLFFLNAEAGHNSKANAIDYLPFIAAGIIWMFNQRKVIGFMLVTLFLGLEFNANHIQITYYGFLFFFILFVTYFIYAYKEKTLRDFTIVSLLFILGTGIGLLPNAGNLMMTNEYSKYSNRSRTELTLTPEKLSNEELQTGGISLNNALSWSNDFGELGTFIIPNYKGGASKPINKTEHAKIVAAANDYKEIVAGAPAYFGSQPFTNGPVYIGVIVILFAFLGAYLVHHKLRWPLLITTLLAVVLSLGSNYLWFTELFFRYIPFYNKFRSITLILVLAQLCIPILAVFGIDHLIRNQQRVKDTKQAYEPETERVAKIVAGVLLAFCLVTAITPTLFSNMQKPEEAEGLTKQLEMQGLTPSDASAATGSVLTSLGEIRSSLVSTDALRAAFFLLATIALFYFFKSGKLKASWLLFLLGSLITCDLLLIANRIIDSSSYISVKKASLEPPLETTDNTLLSDSSYFRVANTLVDDLFLDASTSYRFNSIGGYHAAKLSSYEDVINFSLKPEIASFTAGIDTVKNNDSLLHGFLSQFHVLNMLNTKYFIIRDEVTQRNLVKNKEALGNAWFIKNIQEVISADSEILALRSFDPYTTAIIRSSNKTSPTVSKNYKGEGVIRLNTQLPNKLVYECKTSDSEFAVFSEIWYPAGWKATIDNKPASFLRVNYVLRGLEIPAGKHQIVFAYDPQTYAKGNSIAQVGSLLLLLVILSSGSILIWKSRSAKKTAGDLT